MKYIPYIFIFIILSISGVYSYVDFNNIQFGAGEKVKSVSIANVAEKLDKSPIKSKYTLDKGTLKTVAKDNPKDKIEVSIGRKVKDGMLGAVGDIEPILNISRWDDEVSLSIEKDVSAVATKDRDVSFEADKIVYDTPLEEYNFYDVADSTTTPEGAYEFEVILKEKPATNIVSFNIESKGLDFFYQAELTEKEIAEGSSRPENVIGSYAVYASEDKINYVGGKEYKAGKVGHIYRPQIQDADGNKVWGELNVDANSGLLTVTIPQEFLDKAVYPVRHAAGLTFGYSTIGGSSNAMATNEWHGVVGTPIFSGTIDSVFMAHVADTDYFKPVVTNSSLEIISNGVGNAKQCTNANQWDEATYTTKPSVTASSTYMAGVVVNASITGYYDSTGITWYKDTSNSYASPENPTDASSASRRVAIYASYTPDEPNYYFSSDVGFSYTAGAALSYNNTSNPGSNARIGYRSGTDFGNIVSAFRFSSVTIPQGATINTATFSYTAQDTDATTDNVAVYAEDVDSSPAITTTGDEEPKDKGGRVTSASVNWTLPNQTINISYTSPEIKTVIQEIVDRAGWSSGNSLSLVIKNNGATENHNAKNNPGESWMYVTYTTGGGSTSTPSNIQDSIFWFN